MIQRLLSDKPTHRVLTVALTDQANYASVDSNWSMLTDPGNPVDYIINEEVRQRLGPDDMSSNLPSLTKCSKPRDGRVSIPNKKSRVLSLPSYQDLRGLWVEEIWPRYRIHLSDGTGD